MRQAEVYIKDVMAGRLTEDAEGYSFVYYKEYLESFLSAADNAAVEEAGRV